MAMTQEELKKAQLKQTGSTGQSTAARNVSLAEASPQGGQSNLAGVSQSTLAALQKYGQSYTPSASVTQAQSYLQSVMGQKPGEYKSDYEGQIEALYNQIMNRPKFSYDVNKDPLFQGYKNQYVQQGQKAMQDTVGAASALTGGYGNSWAATAGSQAYQAYLQQLNNLIPEMEARAYSRYQGEGDELRANMNIAQALDQMAYGRHRDTVTDWQADRDFANTMYAQERTWDMNDWQNLQNYYQHLANMENSSYWQGENLAEQKRQADMLEAYRRDQLAEQARQFDANLAEEIRQADMTDAREREKLAEQARQYDASLAEEIRQYDSDAEYRQAQADLAAEQWAKQYEESVRQYNQNFGEDQRQYDTSLAEKQREFDTAQALDQAEFDLKLRQYEDALAQLEQSNSGGNGGDTPAPNQNPTTLDNNSSDSGWFSKIANNIKSANEKLGLEGGSNTATSDKKTPVTIQTTKPSTTSTKHTSLYQNMTSDQIDETMKKLSTLYKK